jgi:hypothetical protein
MNLVRLSVAAILLLTAAVRGPAFLAAAPDQPTAAGPQTREAPPVAELLARLQNRGAPSADRAEAARALGRLGEEGWPAVQALDAACRGDDPQVGLAALEALCRLEAPEGLKRVREALTLTPKAKHEPLDLDSIRDAVTPQLIELTLDPNLQEAALNQLGPRKVEAVAALRRGLDAAAPGTRRTAAVGLCYLGPGARPALPRLLRALADPDPGVCIDAAAAAWKVGRRPEAVSVLAAGLRRPEDAVRIASAAYLAHLVGADAGPAAADLVEALDDPMPAVRDWAVAALKNLGRRAHPDLAAGLRSGGLWRRRLALYVLTGAGAAPETAAAVRAQLEVADAEIRVRAVRLLAELEPARRAELPPLLLPVLRDPEAAASAVDLLLELGPDARVVLPELTALLSDPDPRTALTAAAGLAAAAPERAGESLPVICSALYSGNPTLRPAALDVVMRLGPAARATRHAVLASLAPRVLGKESDDWDLDLEALIQIGAADDALPLLIQALHGDNDEAGCNAMFCLQRLGKKAAPSLRGVLENGRPDAVLRAQRVLRRINPQNKW